MALLNMLHFSLFGNQSNRKMFFRVHILYIEEGSIVYGHDEETRAKNIGFIKEICEKYKFTFTIVPLERIYDLDLEVVPGLDMRVADAETSAKIEEEKKLDEISHATPIGLEDVVGKEIEVEDI
jgi:hypothetical protein